jgi:hypothetical protein
MRKKRAGIGCADGKRPHIIVFDHQRKEKVQRFSGLLA